MRGMEREGDIRDGGQEGPEARGWGEQEGTSPGNIQTKSILWSYPTSAHSEEREIVSHSRNRKNRPVDLDSVS